MDNIPDGIDVDGYFQTERWFKHIEDEIREDFPSRMSGWILVLSTLRALEIRSWFLFTLEEVTPIFRVREERSGLINCFNTPIL